jgi:hypothetical protein
MTASLSRIVWLSVGLFALLLATSPLAIAQTGPGHDLSRWTVDGGGALSSGGGYQLGGTAGQPDAGEMTGGGYTLGGGFWVGPRANEPFRVYLPIVVR